MQRRIEPLRAAKQRFGRLGTAELEHQDTGRVQQHRLARVLFQHPDQHGRCRDEHLRKDVRREALAAQDRLDHVAPRDVPIVLVGDVDGSDERLAPGSVVAIHQQLVGLRDDAGDDRAVADARSRRLRDA